LKIEIELLLPKCPAFVNTKTVGNTFSLLVGVITASVRKMKKSHFIWFFGSGIWSVLTINLGSLSL